MGLSMATLVEVTDRATHHVRVCVYTNNLQSGQLTPIDLIVEEHFHRAAPGGMGGTKAAGNYSPVLVTQLEAKRNNYAGVCMCVGVLVFVAVVVCVLVCLSLFVCTVCFSNHTQQTDVVYLDAKTDTYLEEVSSCNIFVRKGKTIKTPPLGGTILPGRLGRRGAGREAGGAG